VEVSLPDLTKIIRLAAVLQCCGSEMFILDPGSRIGFPSRIPDTGSRVKKIPDPGSASKKLSIFNLKNCFKLGNMIRDAHPGSGSRTRILVFLPILDPGFRGEKGIGSGFRIWIRNTGWLIHFCKILGCHNSV
jgi:hypothetical protein